MSNIVGLNDLNNRERTNHPSTNLARASELGFFSVPLANPVDPQDETFMQMLEINVCPNTQLKSFSVFFSLIITIIFGVQLIWDGLDKTQLKYTFLPINETGPTTSTLACSFTKVSQEYQFWRFITALFVHQNAGQFLGSIVSFLVWTSLFEGLLTEKKMPQFFFLSGLLGNLLSLAILGPGTVLMSSLLGIFGIYGAVLGHLVFNWESMSDVTGERGMWFCQCFVIVLLSFSMTGFGENSLNYFCGFLSGIFVGLCFSHRKVRNNSPSIGFSKHEKIVFRIGISLIGLIVVGALLAICVFNV